MLKHVTEIAPRELPPGLLADRQFATPIIRTPFDEDVNRPWQSKSLPAPELKRATSRLSSIDTAAGTFAGYASLFVWSFLAATIYLWPPNPRSCCWCGVASRCGCF